MLDVGGNFMVHVALHRLLFHQLVMLLHLLLRMQVLQLFIQVVLSLSAGRATSLRRQIVIHLRVLILLQLVSQRLQRHARIVLPPPRLLRLR